MPGDLIVPAALMTAALVAYSYGVWAERVRRYLLPHHVAAFWLGLAFDGAGTERMYALAAAGHVPGVVHSVLGVSAFGLMLLHAVWATWVVAKGTPDLRRGFHRYSLVVWAIWLLPYLGGMIAGIAAGARG